MNRWLRTLRTFLFGFALPFLFLAMFVEIYVSTDYPEERPFMDGDGA